MYNCENPMGSELKRWEGGSAPGEVPGSRRGGRGGGEASLLVIIESRGGRIGASGACFIYKKSFKSKLMIMGTFLFT